MTKIGLGASDLELAWERVRLDISDDKVFGQYPYEAKLFELNFNNWNTQIVKKIRNGIYNPSPLTICEKPKQGSLIRPGGRLSLADRVIYTAAIGSFYADVFKLLSWSQNNLDYCNVLSRSPTAIKWLENPFLGWDDFRKKSLKFIEEGYQYVIFTDIAAFYENISISILLQDLQEIPAQSNIITLLRSCLDRWSENNGSKGIPQGHSASDILSKIYFNSIDKHLTNESVTYCRYSDDIRIFSNDRLEAKNILTTLIRVLRNKGLSLQSQKTKIIKAVDARKEIENVVTVLQNTQKIFIEKVYSVTGAGNPYMNITEAEQLLQAHPDDTPIEIIEKAYQTNFIDNISEDFNKTLFHYLLNRLANSKNDYAYEHSLNQLIEHPEETDRILFYIGKLGKNEKTIKRLNEFIESGKFVYPYQIYEIIKWFDDKDIKYIKKILTNIRKYAYDNNEPPYLRAYAIKLLGKHGNSADLEKLKGRYNETSDEGEKNTIICSITRMAKSKRNSFFAKVERDGKIQQIAVNYAKQNTN